MTNEDKPRQIAIDYLAHLQATIGGSAERASARQRRLEVIIGQLQSEPSAGLEEGDQIIRHLFQQDTAKLAVPRREVEGLPDQDADTYQYFDEKLSRIHRVCERADLALPSSVVGTMDAQSANAFAATLFGSTSLIVVHHEMMTLNLLVAKALALSATRVESNPFRLFAGKRPSVEQLKEAARRFAELARALHSCGNPSHAPAYLLKPYSLHAIVVELLYGLEFFTVGHEYGHLLVAHGKITPSTDEELVADMVAFEALVPDTQDLVEAQEIKGKHGLLRMAAPIAFFLFLGFLEDQGLQKNTGSHPSSVLRCRELYSALKKWSIPLAFVDRMFELVSGVIALSMTLDEWPAGKTGRP